MAIVSCLFTIRSADSEFYLVNIHGGKIFSRDYSRRKKISNRVHGPFSARLRPFSAPKRMRDVASEPLRPPPPRSAQTGAGKRAKDSEEVAKVENYGEKRCFGRVQEGRTPFEGSRSGRTAKNSVIVSDSRDFLPKTSRKRPISPPSGPDRPPSGLARDPAALPRPFPASPTRHGRTPTPRKNPLPGS